MAQLLKNLLFPEITQSLSFLGCPLFLVFHSQNSNKIFGHPISLSISIEDKIRLVPHHLAMNLVPTELLIIFIISSLFFMSTGTLQNIDKREITERELNYLVTNYTFEKVAYCHCINFM